MNLITSPLQRVFLSAWILATLSVSCYAKANCNSTGAIPKSCTAKYCAFEGLINRFQQCVTLDGVVTHLTALQNIADNNNGERAAGTAGYNDSVAYVKTQLEASGYKVTLQPFPFQSFISNALSILEQISPPPTTAIPNTILSYSGSGDVTAPVTVVKNRGCDASDFTGFTPGHIALIERGPTGCSFNLKANNAYNALASGVVIYNDTPEGLFTATLRSTFTADIPVTSVTQATGLQFVASTPGLVLRIKTDTTRGQTVANNIIAEPATTTFNSAGRRGGPYNGVEGKVDDGSGVIMVGAHLDSVYSGPGVQDDGSGVATLLEIARQLGIFASPLMRNSLRFAFWAAEEEGLVGSTYYLNSLSVEERAKILFYMNFDMIASPNHVFFVYDADNLVAPIEPNPWPPGSVSIQRLFESFYQKRGLPYKGIALAGRSDHAPFLIAGIPAGGLFTGAEEIKTEQEAALWGGTAGIAYDPCYHLACDTLENVNRYALGVNIDAVAYATLKSSLIWFKKRSVLDQFGGKVEANKHMKEHQAKHNLDS